MKNRLLLEKYIIETIKSHKSDFEFSPTKELNEFRFLYNFLRSKPTEEYRKLAKRVYIRGSFDSHFKKYGKRYNEYYLSSIKRMLKDGTCNSFVKKYTPFSPGVNKNQLVFIIVEPENDMLGLVIEDISNNKIIITRKQKSDIDDFYSDCLEALLPFEEDLRKELKQKGKSSYDPMRGGF